MSKVAFIIPSYFSNVSDQGYKRIGEIFEDCKYNVVYVSIDWKFKTISDYKVQFRQIYEKNKGEVNIVFGFSFGAMIALLTAKEIKPTSLILASLSPYFSEDLDTLTTADIEAIGRKRFIDLQNHSFNEAVSGLRSKTHLLYGERELSVVKERSIKGSREITKAVLIEVENGKHNINDDVYFLEIKKVIDGLEY